MAGLGKRQNTGETSFIDNVTGQKIVKLGEPGLSDYPKQRDIDWSQCLPRLL